MDLRRRELRFPTWSRYGDRSYSVPDVGAAVEVFTPLGVAVLGLGADTTRSGIASAVGDKKQRSVTSGELQVEIGDLIVANGFL